MRDDWREMLPLCIIEVFLLLASRLYYVLMYRRYVDTIPVKTGGTSTICRHLTENLQ